MKPLCLITPREPIPFPRLYRVFEAPHVQRAVLEVTGLGLYRAFLNGQRVGEDWLTPGFNDYDAWLASRTYDVTDLLKPGENTLEIWLGRGWYSGRLGFDREHPDCIWGSDYLAGARLTMTDADGSTVLLQTDASWQAAATPIRSGDIYDGEVRDDTAPLGDPVPCVPVERTYSVEPDQAPPVRVCRTFKPTLIRTPREETVLDFGQNMAGTVRFRCRARRGETVRLSFGELLQDGCFYRDNLRSARAEFVYTSDGVEREIEPFFTFYGFQYAKVEAPYAVDPEDFTALALTSQLPVTLRCETANPEVNKLIKNTFWGQRSNFVSVPTDCPQRDERLGWTADTQVFCRTALYQMDCRAFYRKYIRDMRHDQVAYLDGDVPKYSPSLRGQAGHGGAVWADAGGIIPWELYRTYGDRELLEESYPLMHDYAEFLIREDLRQGGTHVAFDTFTFGDWLALDGKGGSDCFGGTNPRYIQGIYYMYALRLTAQAAAMLNRGEDARRYSLLEAEIRAALLDEYFTPGGHLCVDTQTGYVLALTYGLWRDKETLLRDFRRRLDLDNGQLRTGFTGTPLLLPALLDNGMTEEAYRILLNPGYPGWLYAVRLGATTVWERWNSLLPDGRISGTDMNSMNHYANGSVCEAIYSRMAGLRCGEPGWHKAIIAPHMSAQLPEISLAYDSPAGTYQVHWTVREQNRYALEITVPEGCSAQVLLPEGTEISCAGPCSERWEGVLPAPSVL